MSAYIMLCFIVASVILISVFGGITGAFVGLAKFLFFICIIVFVVSFVGWLVGRDV